MHLLVIEDDPRLSRLLKRLLEDDRHVVELATDGRTGLEIAEDAPGIECVILDIGLPDISGLEVARRLRAQGSDVTILMLTARDTVGDRVTGLDAGADDYLVKPFAFEELAARLRALVRRPHAGVPVVLRAGAVVLDPARREAAVAGKIVPMTTKELSLLELFLRHPGQVLTREQISRHLWDHDFEGDSNVLEVHVRNVRRKLSEAGYDDGIETVRGAGYRLRD